MTDTVERVETPDGIFYTSRKDNRTSDEVVAHGIEGYNNGSRSPIYESLKRHRTCSVLQVSTGLDKISADALKKKCIIDARTNGEPVLNVRL